jgi:hypothetical protein
MVLGEGFSSFAEMSEQQALIDYLEDRRVQTIR